MPSEMEPGFEWSAYHNKHQLDRHESMKIIDIQLRTIPNTSISWLTSA